MWFLLPQHFGLRGCLEHHNMFVEDFAVSTNDDGIEFVTYEETPRKLTKVDFTWNEELFNPRCLLLVDRGALLKCSKHFWNEDPKKCETVVHYLAVNEWPMTQVWCKWQRMGINSINSFMKNMASQADIQGKKLQTIALTKPWWRSWKLQTNCSERLSVCANERSFEDYEEGDENEQWDISSIISAEFAMAQSSRVHRLLAKIRCCKHSCGDHFRLEWWKVGDSRPFPWLSTFFLAAIDVWIYMKFWTPLLKQTFKDSQTLILSLYYVL